MCTHQTRKFNHLQDEKSPYLLQHADNPVDWYPWGDEALGKAQTENKPIFISIGYSTCHWCHVMAHESFEDELVAAKLNQNYVAIKVDREERPDIDAGFMHACQLMNGHGGWPLNLFLTPMGKPFYALTYAPKHTRGQQPGFVEIIDKIAELWERQADQLIDAGQQLSQAILNLENHQSEEELGENILNKAANNYQALYDNDYAGFGQPPKFPQPHNPALLLRLAQRFGSPRFEEMALQTLNHIERGGITDQLGGGMHRYSVDRYWLTPHFEKMLYDQALISEAYLDAWQISGSGLYEDATKNVLDYVLRELQHPDGGFYCGEDADSEGAEGTYYLWTLDELDQFLAPEEKDFFTAIYKLTPQGNFEGKNILYRDAHLKHYASKQGYSEPEFRKKLKNVHLKLLLQRNQRLHPHLDDKILTGWNGLMIAAMARAGFLLQCPRYLSAAQQAVDFIRNKLTVEGRLKRRYRDGETTISAFHEDYAYLIRGLIELFLADGNRDNLIFALELAKDCDRLFSDKAGSYYDSSTNFIEGMGRGRNKQDGAVPAAASVTAHNLIRLARLTGQPKLEDQAQKLLKLHLTHADQHPTAFAFLLQALDLHLSASLSLVIVTNDDRITDDWLTVIRQFRPHMVTVVTREPQKLSSVVPFTVGKSSQKGQTTAWFCTGASCLDPVTQPTDLQTLLDAHAPLKTFIR